MKKLLTILLLIPVMLFSQEWIGYSHKDITSVLKKNNTKYKELENDDSTSIIIIQYESYKLALVFTNTKSKLCFIEVYTPRNSKELNKLVSWFNLNTVIVSNTEWQSYDNGIISSVELLKYNEHSHIVVKYLKTYE